MLEFSAAEAAVGVAFYFHLWLCEGDVGGKGEGYVFGGEPSAEPLVFVVGVYVGDLGVEPAGGYVGVEVGCGCDEGEVVVADAFAGVGVEKGGNVWVLGLAVSTVLAAYPPLSSIMPLNSPIK